MSVARAIRGGMRRRGRAMTTWRRVNRRAPCVVCGRPKYCGIAADGSAAICMWVKGDRPTRNGGWLHRLTLDTRIREHVERATVAGGHKPLVDFGELAGRYARAAGDSSVKQLARSLGVSTGSLRRLHVGFDGRAFTFPMCDGAGRIIGIRRRFPNGGKCCVTGSATGLFIPTGLLAAGVLFIAEGPTDCAALLDLGYYVIGRPSCRGGTTYIVQLARNRNVIIVGDADGPGQRGAIQLAPELRPICPSVQIIIPPPDIKDARAWLQAGATPRDIELTLRDGPIVRFAEPTRRAVGVTYRETG